MNINVVAKGFDLIEGTHEGIEQELTDLSNILKVDPSYHVMIKKRVYGEYECTINTYFNNHNYKVKATRRSIRASIEAAAKALKEMALEDHAKFLSKKMNNIQSDWDSVDMGGNTEEKKNSVTKQKEVYLTPISDDEAIEALNDSDKDMYMYLDEETLEVKGVYHRTEGYGVITFKTT